ncbi:MAG: hypothetical protein AAFX78_01820 [Cyanobacteria bacterium J06638_20]
MGLPETPLDVALDFALQTDLNEESRQELAGFVNYLNEHPERARAVAIETKIALLKVKEMHSRALGAIESSGLDWLEQWRLRQGEAIAPPAPTIDEAKAESSGPVLLPKPKPHRPPIAQPCPMTRGTNLRPTKRGGKSV